MKADESTKGLDDGRAHAVPCRAARHGDDPPMLYVRHLTDDDVWLLHCWSSPPCEYGEIARLLDIDTDPAQAIRRGGQVAHLVAAYDRADRGKEPGLVFHPWRDEADSPPSRGLRGSRERRFRGNAQGVHLMLWAPDEADRGDSTLVVVGSEDEAISLMRSGVYKAGIVPVTWYRPVRCIEDDHSYVNSGDWSRVRGRSVVVWPARTPQGHAEMMHAAGKATFAEAARLLWVDTQGSGLGEGDDAASMTDPDEIMAVLSRVRVLPMFQGESTVPDEPTESDHEKQLELETDVGNETSGIERILCPGVETATDVSMAVRVLREHGRNMVLASGHEGPGVEVYWRTGTGALEQRPDGLGLALWESRGRYLEELREALEAKELSAEDHKVCIAHASRMGSPAGLRAVTASLGTAYGILERVGAVPGGLSRVSISRVDGDPRDLGAHNERTDPDIAHRPSREDRRPRTEADVWILGAIKITVKSADKLSTTALWEAAHSAAGSGENQQEVWGMSRRTFTTRVRQLHGLPRTRSVRIEREVFSGWTGVRLATDSDVAGN